MKLTKDEIEIIIDLIERKIMRITIDIVCLYSDDKDKFELRKELVSLKRIVKKLEE
jgi:hypothetical protein